MDAPQIASNAPEKSPDQAASGAEVVDAKNLESNKPAAVAESRPSAARSDDGVAGAQAQVASVTADDAAAAVQAAQQDPLPATAADTDVLEPEWVKKAEEAVAQHRDDPHAEEDAVEKVQVDYLKKRYNLDVMSSDEKS